MNNNFKFKARAFDGSAEGVPSVWITGYHVDSVSGSYIYKDIVDNDSITSLERFKVDNSTVSISVPGVKDIHGHEVFTNDRVRFKVKTTAEPYDKVTEKTLEGLVKFDENFLTFVIEVSDLSTEYFDLADFRDNIEII